MKSHDSSNEADSSLSPHMLLLIEEYKICASRADQFSALMWQLGTLLVTLSAGAIAIVANFSEFSPRRFLEVLLMASLGILVVQWWNKVADRWNSYIRVWYHRMQEIEPDLNMWINRDIALLDSISGETSQDYSSQENVLDRTTILRKSGVLRGHSTVSIRNQRRHLFMLVSIGWVILTFYFAAGTAFRVFSDYRKHTIDSLDFVLGLLVIVFPLAIALIVLYVISRRVDFRVQLMSFLKAVLPEKPRSN